MLSKATSKFIKSLQIKKYRKQEQCFVVEGIKSVNELIRSDYIIRTLLVTAEASEHIHRVSNQTERLEVLPKELSSVGSFQTNEGALAIAEMKQNAPISVGLGEYGMILDDIRDPGNLGTILRTADWYGIKKIIASEGTADFYNPKVITASMGSFTRLSVYYTRLDTFLSDQTVPIYGTFLEGKNIHDIDFGAEGLIVIGNESNGISPEVAKYITDSITIPRYGQAESLNAGIATAIVLDNVRRSQRMD